LIDNHAEMSRLSIIAAVSICVWASAAWANQGPSGGPAEAEALIREALELRKAGKDARAYPLLQKAYEIHTAPRTAIQLGLVEMQLGYWLEAEQHLGEGLASQRDPWVFNNRASIESSLARVKAAIGEIVVTGTPAGAEVLLNGRPGGKLPLEAPIRAGEGPAKLELRAPGHESVTRSLRILGGRREMINVTMEPTRAGSSIAQNGIAPIDHRLTAPAKDTPPAGANREAWKWTGVALGAAGVVGAAAGVTYLLQRSGCDSLPPGAVCNEQPRTATPGLILLGSGVVAAVTGSVLWYRNRNLQVGLAFAPGPMLVLKGAR
jgi:hypothetical protein